MDIQLLHNSSGVATVWLLATLGKSKRISKKDVQSVSIPQTCTEIKNPQLALRVSSSLLHGVSLVYKHKTEYLSTDASSIRARIQRDLLKFKNGYNKNTHTATLMVPVLDENGFNLGVPATVTSTREFVLLNDDPLFNIDDGLLPPMPDFFSQTASVLTDSQKRKSAIHQDDSSNNTISSGFLDDDVFSKRIIDDDLDDELINANPEFAFNEDGFLLEFENGDQTTIGNPVDALHDGNDDDQFRFQDNMVDFDMDFNIDEERVRTGDSLEQIRRQDVHSELDQVLEEVEQNPTHSVDTTEKSKKQIKKRPRAETRPIMVDDSVSLSTDELRVFRDHYVEIMQSKQKKPKTAHSINEIRLITEDIEFLPNLSYSLSNIAPLESRRGRSPNRHDDEDFIDSLMRNRRSSGSIETARNSSRLSRRESRSSISGLNIDFQDHEGNTSIQKNREPNSDYFDVDFGDVLGHDDSTSTTDNSSKRRSNSSINKFATVHEDDELGNNDVGYDAMDFDFREDDERVRPGDDGYVNHDDEIMNDLEDDGLKDQMKQYQKRSVKFLNFIDTRFDEENKDSLTFNELLEIDQNATDKSIVAKSFYEILQLTTFSHISVDIVNKRKVDDYDLLTGDDFKICAV